MNAFDPAALECLAALADTGHFDKAAQQLAITQSAVSQRLRTLETSVGQLLVVRSRPLRFTEAGKLLLRHARQMRAMRADLARALGHQARQDERLPIAVNADSLATWVLPALDELVRRGQDEGFGIELMVDDQDFTHGWLREGAVLGCVTSVAEPLRGCSTTPLGAMRYLAVASPAWLARWLPADPVPRVHPGNVGQLPWLVFNRKDDMHHEWLRRALGVQGLRLRERPVPSSEAQARAAAMGWGLAVMPEPMAAPGLADGRLQVVQPEVFVDVQLHWHQWRLPGDALAAEAPHGAWPRPGEMPLRGSPLDRIGQALAEGARRMLRPAEPDNPTP